MRLAAGRIGEGDALHDEAARRRGLRRRNQIARSLGADAGIVRIGRGNSRFVEFTRQVGELMDDDLGRAARIASVTALASKTSSTAGSPRPARARRRFGRARSAGDLVAGLQKERHQPPSDGAEAPARKLAWRYAMLRGPFVVDICDGNLLRRKFFARSVHEVAPELIGATLLFKGVGGVIVEVEAYHHTDPAAHSFNGQTARNAIMFGPPGYAYVYRSYGIHCASTSCASRKARRSAVLIRALAPSQGLGRDAPPPRVTDERLLLGAGTPVPGPRHHRRA
jgi:hypothetical protein